MNDNITSLGARFVSKRWAKTLININKIIRSEETLLMAKVLYLV